jgi:WD40 repeat protein
MASWAQHGVTDDKAPFACTLQSGYVFTIDAHTMKHMRRPVHLPFVMECAINKGCTKIACGGMNNMVFIYNISPDAEATPAGWAKRTAEFKTPQDQLESECTHDGYISAIKFVDDGTKVMTASGDSTIKLWDLETKALETTFKGHVKDCTGICTPLEEDGNPNIFGSTSSDTTVRIWDKRGGIDDRKWKTKYSTN